MTCDPRRPAPERIHRAGRRRIAQTHLREAAMSADRAPDHLATRHTRVRVGVRVGGGGVERRLASRRLGWTSATGRRARVDSVSKTARRGSQLVRGRHHASAVRRAHRARVPRASDSSTKPGVTDRRVSASSASVVRTLLLLLRLRLVRASVMAASLPFSSSLESLLRRVRLVFPFVAFRLIFSLEARLGGSRPPLARARSSARAVSQRVSPTGRESDLRASAVELDREYSFVRHPIVSTGPAPRAPTSSVSSPSASVAASSADRGLRRLGDRATPPLADPYATRARARSSRRNACTPPAQRACRARRGISASAETRPERSLASTSRCACAGKWSCSHRRAAARRPNGAPTPPDPPHRPRSRARFPKVISALPRAPRSRRSIPAASPSSATRRASRASGTSESTRSASPLAVRVGLGIPACDGRQSRRSSSVTRRCVRAVNTRRGVGGAFEDEDDWTRTALARRLARRRAIVDARSGVSSPVSVFDDERGLRAVVKVFFAVSSPSPRPPPSAPEDALTPQPRPSPCAPSPSPSTPATCHLLDR